MFSSRIRTCALRPVYTSEAQCVGYSTPSTFLSSLTSVVVVSEMMVDLWKIVFFFHYHVLFMFVFTYFQGCKMLVSPQFFYNLISFLKNIGFLRLFGNAVEVFRNLFGI